MISEQFSQIQFNRMAQLDFPPTTKESVKETLMAICSADNEDQCLRVIDDIISDRTEFPKPAEIRRMMWEVSERKEKADRPKWENTEPPVVKEKNGYRCGFVCNGWGTVGERPNVRFCTCAHADWLKREIPNWLELCNTLPTNNPLNITKQSVPPWLYGMPGNTQQ